MAPARSWCEGRCCSVRTATVQIRFFPEVGCLQEMRGPSTRKGCSTSSGESRRPSTPEARRSGPRRWKECSHCIPWSPRSRSLGVPTTSGASGSSPTSSPQTRLLRPGCKSSERVFPDNSHRGRHPVSWFSLKPCHGCHRESWLADCSVDSSSAWPGDQTGQLQIVGFQGSVWVLVTTFGGGAEVPVVPVVPVVPDVELWAFTPPKVDPTVR